MNILVSEATVDAGLGTFLVQVDVDLGVAQRSAAPVTGNLTQVYWVYID